MTESRVYEEEMKDQQEPNSDRILREQIQTKLAQENFMLKQTSNPSIFVNNFSIMQQGPELTRLIFSETILDNHEPHARVSVILPNPLGKALGEHLAKLFEAIEAQAARVQAANGSLVVSRETIN